MRVGKGFAWLAAISMGMAGGGVALAQPWSDDAALMQSVASLQAGDEVPDSYIVTFVSSTAQQRSPVVSVQEQERALGRRLAPPNFGEHSTGQDKAALAQTLGLKNGRVHRIFDAINAIHVMADAEEAEALRNDPRVLSVEPDRVVSADATAQVNPGWGLDRQDQNSTALNYQYVYTYSGAGQTIYVLDTGLNLGNSRVAAEFGGRATLFWDYNNGGNAYDCHGHGTMVTSAAAGTTYGTAKGAKVRVIKIATGCTRDSTSSVMTAAFNNLSTLAVRGDIINFSFGYSRGYQVCTPMYDTALENAVKAAYNRGIIVVTSAGNDGCDVQNFPVKRLPEAFLVGATSTARLAYNQDARAQDLAPAAPWQSRYGGNVAGFAPGQSVVTLNYDGTPVVVSGTSIAAPYVAGLFASACHTAGTYCQTVANPGVAYQGFKGNSVIGSVVEPNGGALPAGTPSRFFVRNGW